MFILILLSYFFLAGDAIDEDFTKRARTKSLRLYPALSDLESMESGSDNENNYCNAATVSALSTADDELKASMQPLQGNTGQDDDDDNEDRCADRFYSCLLFCLCLD